MKKKHGNPSVTTIKSILSAGGNQCAFDACNEPMFDREHEVIVGKICHIKARSEDGPRFDSKQSTADNKSFNNLIGLCGRHHDIIDKRVDIFSFEELAEMKHEHESKIENSADRSWLHFPSVISGHLNGLEAQTVHFWQDRHGREQVYTDRKLAIARTVFDVYQDINRLCELYKMVEDNPDVPAKSLMQSYVVLNKNKANLDPETPWSPIAQIFCQMGEIPDVTMGEFLSYLVEGGDATNLFVNRARILEEKISTLKKPS